MITVGSGPLLDPGRALRITLVLGTLGIAGNASAALCGTPSPTLVELGADYRRLHDDASATTDELQPSGPARTGLEVRGARTTHLQPLLKILESASLEGIDGERVQCPGPGTTGQVLHWRFDLEQLERVDTAGGRSVLTAFEARRAVVGYVRERHGPANERPASRGADGRRTGHGRLGSNRLAGGVLVAETIDLPSPGAWHPSPDGRVLRSSRRFRRAAADSPTCALVSARTLSPGNDPGVVVPPHDDVIAFGKRCNQLVEITTSARRAGRAIEIEQVFYIDGRRSESTLWRLAS